MIDYGKLKQALRHLDAQWHNYKRIPERDDLLDLDIDAIAESVIQRFEICYDCLWKALKRYMTEDLGLPDLPNSPKPLFRIACENGLVSAVEPWLLYADARTGTAHDYSNDKAEAALSLVEQFLADAGALYKKMTGSVYESA